MKALGYVRVSTDDQETARQEAQIRQHCEAAGLDLVDIYRESDGVSGRARAVKQNPGAALLYYSMLAQGQFAALERSGYAEVLSRASAGEIDAVVIYAIDRLSRDWLELGILELLLSSHGVRIIALSQGGTVDTGSASGKLQYRIQAILATFECDQISERTSATLSHMVRAGAKVGRPPVGWRKRADGAGFEHDLDQDGKPGTWPIVERVHELREQGLKYADIAAAVGMSQSRVKAYLDAYTWTPPSQSPFGSSSQSPSGSPQENTGA